MSNEKGISVAHEGCKFLSCKINFNTDCGTRSKANTRADSNGKNLAHEVMMALVYANGYEGALKLVTEAADRYKHSWPEASEESNG